MAAINQYQAGFLTGLLSPLMMGQVDNPLYKYGLKTAINVVINLTGSATRRPGTLFVDKLQDQTNTSKLIPFIYSNVQTYQLEFNDGSIRFYKDQGQLLQSRTFANGYFLTDINSWTNASTGTGAISWDNTNFRITLTGVDANNKAIASSELIPNFGIGLYTVSMDVYGSTTTYKMGTTVGGSDLATGTLNVGLGQTFTFQPSTNGNICLTIQNSAVSSVTNIVIQPTTRYMIDSPFEQSDIPNIWYDQSFDTMILTDGNHVPYSLVRYGHDNWILSQIQFAEPPWQDENQTTTTITPGATTGSTTFTASSAIFASTDVGRSIRYKSGPDGTFSQTFPGTGSQIYFTIPFYPQLPANVNAIILQADGSQTTLTYTSGSPSTGQYTITNGQVQTGDTLTISQALLIQPANAGSGQWGYATITAYSSPTVVTATIVNPLAGTNASTYWRLGAYSATTGQPAICGFINQRLWFANTTTQPNRLDASNINDFYNFQPDSVDLKGIPAPNSAIAYILDTPSIQWIKGLRYPIVGCSNGIIPIISPGGDVSATVAPSAVVDGSHKCEALPVVTTSKQILLIELLRRKILSTSYVWQINGFQITVDEVNNMADNLAIVNGFKQLAFAETPKKLLWAILDDGTLVSCTFDVLNKVQAWTTHEIGGGGIVESISVIPGATYSELWMVVKRTINGQTARFVEVMQPFYYNQGIENSFFVDAGLQYNGISTQVISGLDYLDGETVTILGNGKALPNETVVNGQITLSEFVTQATIGLGYNSDIEPVYQEGGSRIGSSQMCKSKVNIVGLRLYETLNLQTGIDVDNLTTVPFRSGSDPMDSEPPIFSGDKVIDFDGDWDNHYNIYIRQNLPYPMTVLGILMKADVSD